MGKSGNLNDKKVYESASKILKNHKSFLHDPNSQKEFFSKFKKITKQIEGHRKLLIAIGNL
ncbi:MAG TPA: hypothetical protein DCX95_04140 [Elusimicrobia bacterium]|nr:hypothetical protein [Elusimicrobiota bacterium]